MPKMNRITANGQLITEVFMKTVYLEWVDSCSLTGNLWKSKDILLEASEIDRCKTIGFVLKEDSESITIVNSFNSDFELVSGDVTIPKCAIRKRRVVSWKK